MFVTWQTKTIQLRSTHTFFSIWKTWFEFVLEEKSFFFFLKFEALIISKFILWLFYRKFISLHKQEIFKSICYNWVERQNKKSFTHFEQPVICNGNFRINFSLFQNRFDQFYLCSSIQVLLDLSQCKKNNVHENNKKKIK